MTEQSPPKPDLVPSEQHLDPWPYSRGVYVARFFWLVVHRTMSIIHRVAESRESEGTKGRTARLEGLSRLLNLAVLRCAIVPSP